MHPLIDTAKEYFNHYGYWSIFFGVLLESFGAPLPGETLILVGGLFAAKGSLNLGVVILLGTLAAFMGWNISYAVGYYGGRRFLIKYGKFIFIDEQKFLTLENFVNKHGNKILIIARFIIGLRQFSGFIVGVSKMPLFRFVSLNFIGSLLWVGWWAGIAYYLSKRAEIVFTRFKHLESYFLIGLTLAVIFVLAYHLINKRRQG